VPETRVPEASRPPFDVQEAAEQIRAGSRAWIARAITMVESTKPAHRGIAQELLVALGSGSGGPMGDDGSLAVRVGVTGVPGVGKSTFIDALGSRLIGAGHRVAVLAVDPSSSRTGGSILGDRTRMAGLAARPEAFVRPSPTAGTLGGVAKATREAMVIVEAAGYDVVIVETVGVGQSEIAVAEMVDTFLLLTLARSGDQLQGIKKGVLELADVIAVNKADGPHEAEAGRAARELTGALHLLGTGNDDETAGWQPPVLTCSAQAGTGLDDVWEQVRKHRATLEAAGVLAAKRKRQLLGWTWAMVRDELLVQLRESRAVRELAPTVEKRVLNGELTPTQAAEEILAALRST
jgi:LAO/AO transport system kinase